MRLQPFSKTITKLRKKRGLSLPGLAMKAGLPKSTVWKMECDPKANPKIKTLFCVAHALGVDVVTLFR